MKKSCYQSFLNITSQGNFDPVAITWGNAGEFDQPHQVIIREIRSYMLASIYAKILFL